MSAGRETRPDCGGSCTDAEEYDLVARALAPRKFLARTPEGAQKRSQHPIMQQGIGRTLPGGILRTSAVTGRTLLRGSPTIQRAGEVGISTPDDLLPVAPTPLGKPGLGAAKAGARRARAPSRSTWEVTAVDE